ncbi:MAG: TlpA disulfide reductase family protein [Actinomycetota bacterium]|nr:TlpA disulfide reductase family protein [Actinomycetota bacterium]
MNEHHDQNIVAHLRSALDEVAAKPVVHAAHRAPARRGLDARRWVAIAASVVIVAGAGVGIAMYNGDNTQEASEPVVTATTTPGTAGGMPYFLAAADLAPGEVTSEPGTGGGLLMLAWARNGDLADGLLVMQASGVEAGATVATVADATERVIDGSTLRFDSYGLSAAERDALVAQVIPGSGLPWLLPVDGWTMVAMFTPADGATLFQSFGDTVTLISGPMNVTLLAEFVSTDTITNVTVAGQPGWQLLTPNGTTFVFWREPIGGQWVSLSVRPALADRVEALLLAVVATNVPTTPTITGDTLPTYGTGTDSATLVAPTVAGAGLDGTVVTIDPAATQRPTLVVFVANWCPHCHAFLPNLQAWIADGTVSADIDVVLVATAESATAESSADWLAQLDWPTPVLVDGDNGDGKAGPVAIAYGAPGWPYLVLLNADGTVAARSSGEMSQSQMVDMLATTLA